MNKLIMKEDEDILSFFRTLDHMVERLDGLSRNYRPMLNGERFSFRSGTFRKVENQPQNLAGISE